MRSLADNLRAPLSARQTAELGRGTELETGRTRPPRLWSLYSSAALVMNVFGHWCDRDVTPLVAALGLDGMGVDVRLGFEEPLATGLVGDPPTADVALVWPSGRFVAIESKYGEWLVRRPRTKQVLKDKYFPPGSGVWAEAGLPRCQALAEALNAGRQRYRWLNTAQLLKHALGLTRTGARQSTLIYLYCDRAGRESEAHRAELEQVCTAIGGEVDLRVRTYQQLHAALGAIPGVDMEYLRYFGERYLV